MDPSGDLGRLVGPPDPKRKYDASDEIDGKSFRLSIAVGAIFLNVFLFIKESLAASGYWSEQPSNPQRSEPVQKSVPKAEIEFGELEPVQSGQSESVTPPQTEDQSSAGNVVNFFSGYTKNFSSSYYNQSAELQTSPPARGFSPGNDNPYSGAGSGQPFLSIDSVITPLLPASAGLPSAGVSGAARVVNGEIIFDKGDDRNPDWRDYDGARDENNDGAVAEPAPTNRAPIIVRSAVLPSLWINQTLIIAASQLVDGVYDPDGDTLSVEGLAATAGTVTAVSDGLWHFEPGENFTGEVTLFYQVSDGEFAGPQTALLNFSNVPGETQSGTEESDTITGTLGPDVLAGLHGDDTILSLGGDDIVQGGDGDDRIIGGDGDDTLFGGSGDDTIFGGAGDDVIFAGAGNDKVFGEDGADSLFGEAGDDELYGGTGNDALDGGNDDDVLYGDEGDDFLDGGSGNDELSGDDGDDILVGASGDDIADGGAGDDQFVATDADGDDVYSGGVGSDIYDFSGTYADALVDLVEGVAESDAFGYDVLNSIENIVAGSGDDTIAGDNQDNNLDGNAGEDHISGGDGDDVVTGGDDEDIVSGGSGDDHFIGETGDGDDIYQGDDGSDTYDFSGTYADALVDLTENFAESAEIGFDTVVEIENIEAGSGDDIIHGDDEANRLDGNDGDDYIYGCDGDDIIVGGAGDDEGYGGDGDDHFVAEIGDGDDYYEGGDGEDTYDVSAITAQFHVDLAEGHAFSDESGADTLENIENVIGGQADDIIVGDGRNNYLRGSDGRDVISGLDGNDKIRGEEGDDLLDGGLGDDRIDGEEGDDIIIGGKGDDTARGDEGDDTFIALAGDGDDSYSGGSGIDTYDLSSTSADAVIDLLGGTAVSVDIGNDQISSIEYVLGGSGNDTIIANDKVNVLSGGEGNDTFVFSQQSGSRSSDFWQDYIEDFELGDSVDVSLIDSDDDVDGNQDFEFVLDRNSELGPGQLTLRYDFNDNDPDDINTVITGFIDSDQVADFEIVLRGQHVLSADQIHGAYAAA